MSDAMFDVPFPQNEPMQGYLPGSPEKAELKAALKELAGRKIEIPLVIGGQEVRTGKLADCVMPHDHKHVLGQLPQGGREGGQGRHQGRGQGQAGLGRHAVRSTAPPSC